MIEEMLVDRMESIKGRIEDFELAIYSLLGDRDKYVDARDTAKTIPEMEYCEYLIEDIDSQICEQEVNIDDAKEELAILDEELRDILKIKGWVMF